MEWSHLTRRACPEAGRAVRIAGEKAHGGGQDLAGSPAAHLAGSAVGGERLSPGGQYGRSLLYGTDTAVVPGAVG